MALVRSENAWKRKQKEKEKKKKKRWNRVGGDVGRDVLLRDNA